MMPSHVCSCPMGYQCELMTGYHFDKCPNARICSILQYTCCPSAWDVEIEETPERRQERIYQMGYLHASAMVGEGNND